MRQLEIRSDMALGYELLVCDVRPDDMRKNRCYQKPPTAPFASGTPRSKAFRQLARCGQIPRILST